MESDEYVKLVGAQRVDLSILYATEKKSDAKLDGGEGGFLGWAENPEQCETKYRKKPEVRSLETGDLSMEYAGQCEGGIISKQVKCGVLDGPWPKGVVDMLMAVDKNVSSVYIKGYDYLLAPDNKELDELGLRDSMLFSEEIRGAGDEFILSAFGGRKYLAAHCRRTDFLKVRQKTTPSADVIAARINVVLAETGIDQVFIATDAPSDLREDLQRQVKATVRFYAGNGARSFAHPGKQAAAEIWIAARADFFIGTIESRFTMWIQLERGFLGKPKETSEQEFCKEYKDENQKCIAPHYRQPGRPGAHREACNA